MCGVSRTVLGGLPQKMPDEREWLAGCGSPILLLKLREPDKCLGTLMKWRETRGRRQLLRSPEGPAVWLWHLGLPTDGRWPRASCGELSQQVARHQEAGSSPAPSLSCFPPLRIPDLQPSMLSSPGHENSFGVAGISACRPIHFAPEIVISSSSDVR